MRILIFFFFKPAAAKVQNKLNSSGAHSWPVAERVVVSVYCTVGSSCFNVLQERQETCRTVFWSPSPGGSSSNLVAKL